MIVDNFKPTNQVKFQTSAVVSSYLNPMEHKIVTIEVGQKIQDVLDSNELSDVVIYKDDLLVSTDYIAKENDVFYIYLIPEGGENFNGMLKMAAMIAVTYYTGGLVGATTWGAGATAGSLSFLGSLAVAGASIVATMALNKLLPPDIPTTGDSLGTDSATYGWDNPSNQKAEGAILPILLGTHKIKPPYINAYIKNEQDQTQTLNQLFAVNLGEIDSIDNVQINNNSIYNYAQSTFHIRFGTPDQEPIGTTSKAEPNFTETRTDFSQGNLVLGTDWYNFTTAQEVHKVGLQITFNGLCKFDNSGNLAEQSVLCYAQYSSDNGVTWTNVIADEVSPNSAMLIIQVSNQQYLLAYLPFSEAGGFIIAGQYTTTFGGNQSGLYIIDSDGTTWYEYVNATMYAPTYGTLYNGTQISKTGNYGIAKQTTYWSTSPTPISGYTKQTKTYGSRVLSGTSQILLCKAKTQETVSFVFETPILPTATYKMRIKRGNAVSTDVKVRDKAIFTSRTEYLSKEVTNTDGESTTLTQRYPSVALLAIKALATDQLSGSLPTVSAVVQRLGKDEDRPLDNPAWACRFLITEYLDGSVNETKFSEWATYCDDNGYSVNIYLETQMSFKKVLDMIASLGQGYIFQKGLQWDCRWESYNTAPVQAFIFNDSNIAYDSYNEEYINIEERFNTLELTYFDSTLDYERNTLIMQQDSVDIEKKTSLVLYGCTSRDMAVKLGKIALRKMRYETLISSWSCDIDALHCGLYDIVYVQHSAPKWSNGIGSLVQSATSNTITLDQDVTLDVGVAYRVRVQHIDTDIVEEKFTVPVSVSTTTSTLTLASSFTSTPSKNSKYTFADGKYFKVINISKLDDLKTKITAIEYIPEIYNIEDEVPVADYVPKIGTSNIMFNEFLQYNKQGNVEAVLNISFVSNQLSNDVYVSNDDITYNKYGQSSLSNSKNIYGLIDNTTYYFKVNDVKTSHLFIGKFAKPNAIDSLSGSEVGNVFTLTWEHEANNIDIDFLEYVVYYGTTEIGRTKNKTFSYLSKGLDTKTFTVKSIDTSAVLSDGVSVEITAAVPNAITNLNCTETGNNFTLVWDYEINDDFREFIVYYANTEIGRTKINKFEYFSKGLDTKTFKVITQDTGDNNSAAVSTSITATAPSGISSITATNTLEKIVLNWNYNKPDDFLRFGLAIGSKVYYTQDSYFEYQLSSKENKFTVWVEDTAGNESSSLPFTYTVSNLLDNVTNIVEYYNSNKVAFTWEKDDNINIKYQIRDNSVWNIGSIVQEASDNIFYPSREGEYSIKKYYKNTYGYEFYSATAEVFSIEGDLTLTKNVIATFDERALDWAGTKDNVNEADDPDLTYDGALTISSATLIDDILNVDLLANFDLLPESGTDTRYGTYQSSNVVTLSSVQSCFITSSIQVIAKDFENLMDYIIDFDNIGDFDGDLARLFAIKRQISISMDGTTFGAWKNQENATYVGKAFKFRVEFYSYKPSVKPYLKEYSFAVDMPDRIDKGTITTSTTYYDKVHSTPFNAVPQTVCTIVDAQEGDSLGLSNETTTGFRVFVKNSGSYVARNINYLSKGY